MGRCHWVHIKRSEGERQLHDIAVVAAGAEETVTHLLWQASQDDIKPPEGERQLHDIAVAAAGAKKTVLQMFWAGVTGCISSVQRVSVSCMI
jgi:hypothetical protein